MTEPLPHRGFTELPAPPQGVSTAVRAGRRIRHRRRAAGAGAGLLSVALVAGAIVATSNGGPSATDQLIPANAPTPSAVPSASRPAPEPTPTTPSRPGAALVSPSPSPVPAPPLLPRRASASPSPARVVAADPGGYRTPDLVRRYQRAPSPSGGPAGRICSGGADSSSGGITSAAGYCLDGQVVRTARGHDLVVRMCRDSTGGGRLRFPRELEADLLVRDPDDRDRVVWQWAAGRTNDSDPHGLNLEASACWTWTAPWTDVDRTGRPLAGGLYELEVVSHATELRTSRADRISFSVG